MYLQAAVVVAIAASLAVAGAVVPQKQVKALLQL
jgi:hypothetical protein